MIAESRPSQATFLKEVDRAMGIEPTAACSQLEAARGSIGSPRAGRERR